ncbi:MAG: RsmD family RNA methyltransferase [Spirochaetaceae bacterium]|jgi:16S rRNA (guanine(966)-N(2))-methyltransferase RsmD|nr:RsmD family RNA methyltransferase [Spirochaetaceae bacterium]
MGSSHSGLLRISGGSLGGRTIPVPPGVIRPAMDRMRESVFAVLGELNGASFLDLFSGSGIIALEAASRGASRVDAVESDPGKRKDLIANAGLSPVRINCHFMAVEMYIRNSHRNSGQAFDFIFCDPPFSYKYKEALLLSIGLSPLMSETSLLLIHRPKPEQLNGKTLELRETRLYGNSAVDFFHKKIEF